MAVGSANPGTGAPRAPGRHVGGVAGLEWEVGLHLDGAGGAHPDGRRRYAGGGQAESSFLKNTLS